MTMYFPLVVHGAMLVEPTETESKAALDQFIGALRSVAERAQGGRREPQGRAGPRAAAAARRDAGGAQAGAGLSRPRARRGRGGPAADVGGRMRTPLLRRRRRAGARRSAPAALRNREPIARVLADWLPRAGLVLEIASGTGEHAVYFAGRFPDARMAAERRATRCARLDRGLAAASRGFRIPPADRPRRRREPNGRSSAPTPCSASTWSTSARGRPRLGLLDGAARILPAGAPLILYGPWLARMSRQRRAISPSTRDFKRRDPSWGLRRVEDFAAAAKARDFALVETRAMPANNLMLLFRRRPR